jgi:type IV pilus assembly protein PilB
MITFDEDRQNQALDELRKKEAEDLARTLAGKAGLQYINLAAVPIDNDGLRLIPETVSKEAGIAVFDSIGKRLKVAVLSVENEKTKQSIAELEAKGYLPTVYLVTLQSLKKAWDQYRDLSYATESKGGAIEISSEEIQKFASQLKSLSDITGLIKGILSEKKSYQISRMLEATLAGALSLGASDIHIEPQEKTIRLRYRLDGVLHDILDFDAQTFSLILSRIKLLSGLKLNVKAAGQDGRFSVKLGEDDIEIRTSVLPGAYSESIVLRILNPKSIAVPLESLGIRPKLLDLLIRQINKPNGMILTTGPTGSGKTTTLYAFLRKVHTPEIKIITIEDPIEYHLPGIVQTQTNPEKGYTFAEGLRSALRQDPDIIMVGEIRDEETAEIAVNSALTGHLVFSTLHTNTAAGTFPRLIDLKINPKVMSSAINVAMAQRLLRRLCPDCKREKLLDGKDKSFVEKVVTSIPTEASEQIPNQTKVWTAVGCDKCNMTGYRGRIGVYEAIVVDDAVSKTVTENPSEREIKQAALPQHILDMRQDGVLKALEGITSLDELGRVVDLEETDLSAKI